MNDETAMKGPWLLHTGMLTGLFGALVLLPIELWALAPLSLRLVVTVASLLACAGLVVGCVLSLADVVVERGRLRPLAASLIRAAGALPVLFLLGRSLFQGGLASTLPGAAWGPLWLPLVGWLALAGGIALLGPVAEHRVGRRALALLLGVALVGIELANRRLYRSEYPDVHAILIVVAVVLGGLTLRLVAPPLRRAAAAPPAARRIGMLSWVAITAAAYGIAVYGLADTRLRWALVTRGTHGRHLARLLRSVSPQVTSPVTASAAPAGTPLVPALNAPVVARPAPPPPPPSVVEEMSALAKKTRGLNLLLLSVDALRADVLAPTPENERDFPNLSALLQSSRRFHRAFSASSATDLSLACFFTGRISPFVNSAAEQTLPEALQKTGRLTHAVLPREVLRWAGENLITRGFQSVDRVINDPHQRDVGSRTTSAETTDRGLAFLDKNAGQLATRPFFLWLHYFDVHEHGQIGDRVAALREIFGSGGARSQTPLAKYRALLRIVDREIGRALDDLRKRGMWDRTVVLFMSDHGESLGEDPRFPDWHGHFLYNPLIHIPVALRIPEVAAGGIDTPVSLIDMMPTVLQLAGVPVPDGLDGVTLAPYLVGDAPRGPARTGRPIVLNESDQYGLLLWPHKLLVRSADRLVELYDIEQDFSEHRDLSESLPDKVAELHALYQQYPKVLIDRSPRGRRQREQITKPKALPE